MSLEDSNSTVNAIGKSNTSWVTARANQYKPNGALGLGYKADSLWRGDLDERSHLDRRYAQVVGRSSSLVAMIRSSKKAPSRLVTTPISASSRPS
ncbi:hypothetical protein [Rhizobium sp. 2YAF20]|uniref:hypothetical protein n=1 Tax=Rhizobium sp. 2YAF20 TaxID=3233027 RepID=UPI003F950CA3